MKEPPLTTANTVLSILAVDYPVEKIACYVSDDGAAMLTFEALSETSEFARKWVPFCKKFNIEPRAPEWYFARKVDYLRDKVNPSFVRERRAMKVRFTTLRNSFDLFPIELKAGARNVFIEMQFVTNSFLLQFKVAWSQMCSIKRLNSFNHI